MMKLLLPFSRRNGSYDHPDDIKEIRVLFDKALSGEEESTRLNFRQRNVKGEYEWWEYRSSIVTGLTQDSLYNILGVCQSIQRYKTAEQEMREAVIRRFRRIN